MASKVNLLGQRLRGAQFEVSRPARQHRSPAAGSGRRRLHLQSRAPPGLRLRLGREVSRPRPRRSCRANRCPTYFRPPRLLGLLVAQASQTGRRDSQPARVPVAAARQTHPAPPWCCSPWTSSRSSGRAGRRQRSPGPPARPRSAAQDQPRTADRRPPVGHQPHLQRRRPRGEEPAQRHPAACRSGALQALSRRHRCRRTDGHHLARDSAPGSRGAHLPGFHPSRGVEIDNVPMQELVREIVDLARPQTEAGNIQVTRRFWKPKASRCGWIATCSNRPCSTWWSTPCRPCPKAANCASRRTAGEDTAELRISDTGSGHSDRTARQNFPPVLQHQDSKVRESAWP